MNRTSFIAALLGILLLVAACGQPEVTVQNVPADTDGDQPVGISVAGTGRVYGAPDTLTLSMGVSVLRSSVSDAVADAAAIADGLISTLKSQGVEDADIQTANYSIYPEYDYRDGEQTLRGYRVNNSVTAKIRDLERAGEIVDAASAAAGDEVVVNGLSFSLEDNEELLIAAREAAWNDAKAKAEQLATLAGVTLGSPLTISESLSTPPQPVYLEHAAPGAADVATPIEAGEQAVAVNLSVRWSIIP